MEKFKLMFFTKTEKKIIAVLSRGSFTIKDLSIIFEVTESTISSQLCNLRKKKIILSKSLLTNPSIKLFYCNDEINLLKDQRGEHFLIEEIFST